MSLQAVIEINGKQYPVEEGRYINIDLHAGDAESTLTIDKVCLLSNGTSTWIGQPYVEGATATAKIQRHFKGPKIIVYKMRCKKGYRRKNGHRQQYTQLMIDSLQAPA